MVQTSITKAAAAMLVQLDLAISERLVDDPQTLVLFDAYNNLLDVLYAGLSDKSLPADYDELVQAKLERAEAALARLGVMGRPLPNANAS